MVILILLFRQLFVLQQVAVLEITYNLNQQKSWKKAHNQIHVLYQSVRGVEEFCENLAFSQSISSALHFYHLS